MFGWQRRLRRAFYELRTEGEGAGREAAALGLGVFIGCTPFYGFHLLLCWVVGWAARLNRLKLYLAANISNPLFSPFLIFTELQVGAWARRQDLHDLTLATIRHADPGTFGIDLLVGSAVVGASLGLFTAAATYATGGLRGRSDPLAILWQRASDPYLEGGITAWEFARGKLRGDPVYRALLEPGVLPSGGTLLDIGCGQGLALSTLRSARRLRADGNWVGPSEPPVFDRMVGIELRSRVARLARIALGDDVEIVQSDARDAPQPACSAVLLLDVLHMIPFDQQETLVGRAAAALDPGGVMLVREADAIGGWGFTSIRLGNRLKALVTGNWRQRFFFRSHSEWAALLARHGLHVDVRDARSGTPFANSLMVGLRGARRPPLHETADTHEAHRRAAGRVVFAAEPERAGRP